MEPKHVPMSKVARRPPRWLWPDRIPYGCVTLLAAKTEVGKSSFVGDIAARVTRGEKFPGSDLLVAKGKAVIFCGEEDKECAPRVRAEEQGADLTRLHIADDPFTIEEQYEYLAKLVREGFTFFAFDPITSYTRHQYGQGLRDEFVRINKFFRKHSAAVVGIVHFTKAGGSTVLTSIRGGGQWVEVCRHVTALAKLDPSDPNSPVIFGNVKTNLTRGDVPITGFRIVTNPKTGHPVLTWVDDVDLPPSACIDALVKEANKTGKLLPTKLGLVEEAMETLLTENGGRLDGDYVMDELKKRTGAGERTIREAKARLGVKSVPTGKHKYDWVLDAAPATDDPAVQQALQRVAGSPTIQ